MGISGMYVELSRYFYQVIGPLGYPWLGWPSEEEVCGASSGGGWYRLLMLQLSYLGLTAALLVGRAEQHLKLQHLTGLRGPSLLTLSVHVKGHPTYFFRDPRRCESHNA